MIRATGGRLLGIQDIHYFERIFRLGDQRMFWYPMWNNENFQITANLEYVRIMIFLVEDGVSFDARE
jgi:hypothetical protein